MFFFIGGIQPRTILVDEQPKSCSACGFGKVYLKRIDHHLSLFFIPLFPIKRGIPFLICENCNTVYDERGFRMEEEQAERRRRCPHCGRPVNPDFVYCPCCGKSI